MLTRTQQVFTAGLLSVICFGSQASDAAADFVAGKLARSGGLSPPPKKLLFDKKLELKAANTPPARNQDGSPKDLTIIGIGDSEIKYYERFATASNAWKALSSDTASRNVGKARTRVEEQFGDFGCPIVFTVVEPQPRKGSQQGKDYREHHVFQSLISDSGISVYVAPDTLNNGSFLTFTLARLRIKQALTESKSLLPLNMQLMMAQICENGGKIPEDALTILKEEGGPLELMILSPEELKAKQQEAEQNQGVSAEPPSQAELDREAELSEATFYLLCFQLMKEHPIGKIGKISPTDYSKYIKRAWKEHSENLTP